ncbi:MAG: hypothetical protein DRG09_02655 [Epsilonproteobacteria bacterium]|nr:MAG: hypothetical protein DRG09_02655 [Campylobacterota bacterium]
MNKRYIPIGSFVLLIGIALWITSVETESKSNKAEAKDTTHASLPSPKQVIRTKDTSAPKVSKSSAGSKKVVYIKEKRVFDNAFEPIDIAELRTSYPPMKGVEPISAFKLKQNTIKDLYNGDTLALPEINGYDYSLTIEKRVLNTNGSVTLEASLEGEDKTHLSILTEGDKTSFITLSTSEGIFEIQTLNGKGYVYSSTDIKNARIDYSKTDTLIPHQKH